MKRKHPLLALLAVLLISSPLAAQLSGSYSVPGSYTSIGAAINALNTLGVSGASRS